MVRDYLRKKLADASVGQINIERAGDARITIHSAAGHRDRQEGRGHRDPARGRRKMMGTRKSA